MDPTSLPILVNTARSHGLIGEGGIDGLQLLMLMFAVLAVTVVMISTWHRIRASQRASRTPARETYAAMQERQHASRDLEAVMLELDQLSRQIHGRIDTKLARLEALIHDADQRIEKLSRLTRAANAHPTLEVTLDAEDPLQPPRSEPQAEDNPHAAVFSLADRGLCPAEIARETGKLQGEVELVLALRKTEKEASGPSNEPHTLPSGSPG